MIIYVNIFSMQPLADHREPVIPPPHTHTMSTGSGQSRSRQGAKQMAAASVLETLLELQVRNAGSTLLRRP